MFFGNGYYTRTDRGKGRCLCFRLWHSGVGRESPRRRYERPRRGPHRDAARRVSRIPSGESSKSGVDAFARGELPGRSRTCRRQSATESLGGTIGGRKNRATRRQIARVRLARREHKRKIVKLQGGSAPPCQLASWRGLLQRDSKARLLRFNGHSFVHRTTSAPRHSGEIPCRIDVATAHLVHPANPAFVQ